MRALWRVPHTKRTIKKSIMTKIADKLTDLIGNTPLLRLNKFSHNKGLSTPVIAKV